MLQPPAWIHTPLTGAGSVVLTLMGSAILWESTEDLKVRRVEIVPQKPLDLAC